VFGGEMQFAHFLFFLREAVAIPMAVKWMNLFGWVTFVGAASPRSSSVGTFASLGSLAERSAKLGLLCA
jgi:hypothetical protein